MTDKHDRESKTLPAHTIRLGLIRCTIWGNETRNGIMYGTVVSRNYRDEHGEYHETSSLRRDDLLLAGKILDMAHTWISEKDQEMRQSQD